MDEDELKKFVPLLGDRLALRKFSEESTQKVSTSSSKSSKKDSLLCKLRQKLGMKRDREDGENSIGYEDSASCSYGRTHKMLGNKNAERLDRRIDVGWMDFDHMLGRYKQVRKTNGGGIRSLSVSKLCKPAELLQIVEELFFPDGISAKGEKENFECSLVDFRQQPLEGDVGQLYSRSKMPTLRFYLRTVSKVQEHDKSKGKSKGKSKVKKRRTVHVRDHEYDTSSSEADLPEILLNSGEHSTSTHSSSSSVCCLEDDSTKSSNLFSGVKELADSPTISFGPSHSTPTQEQLDVTIRDPVNSLPAEQILAEVITDEPSTFVHEEHQHEQQADQQIPMAEDQMNDFPTVYVELVEGQTNDFPTNQTQFEVLLIRRSYLITDMMNAFSDESILKANIAVHMILHDGNLEKGQGNGVYKDAITQFWDEVYEQMTSGDSSRIPVLRHDYGEKEWQTLGRIITKGWWDHKYFPIRLTQDFMVNAIWGSTFCNGDMVEAFLSLLPESEKEVVKSALSNFPEDIEELIDILSGYDCRKVPTNENFSCLLSELGHKEIIQKPMYIADCMRPVLQNLQNELTQESLSEIYASLHPTSKKVIDKLEFSRDLSPNERAVSTYLKKYLRSLNQGMLRRFLRYCTGLDILCNSDIRVTFCSLDGLQRRPIGHTCGNVIELSSTYDDYIEFRQEFNHILESGLWVMDAL